jgi:hypothetical protein
MHDSHKRDVRILSLFGLVFGGAILRAQNPPNLLHVGQILNEKASAHVSDADIASGQDQINERDQGGSDTGRNEEIVGVDIVHGIEPWMGCLSHGLICTADGTETL